MVADRLGVGVELASEPTGETRLTTGDVYHVTRSCTTLTSLEMVSA